MCVVTGLALGAAYSAGVGMTAPALLTAGAIDLAVVGSLAGAGISAYSAQQTGKFNSDMARYQAKLNDQRSSLAKEAGKRESEEAALRRRLLVGQGKTQFAANGLLLDGAPTSAPNVWEQDQMAELAYEQDAIRRNAELSAWGYTSQSAMDRSSASMASFSGRLGTASALIGGAGSAAGTALTARSLGTQLTA